MIIGTVSQQLLFLTGDGEDDMIQAWVNFNGTGTVAIRDQSNVSSITDHGTGDYTVNFTTALSDANYSIAGSASSGTSYNGDMGVVHMGETYAPTNSGFRFWTAFVHSTANLTRADSTYVNLIVVG